MQKSKNYTALALFIPFSIALAASVFPLRDTKLNYDIPVCEQKQLVYVEYFKEGDVLPPESPLGGDTLVVVCPTLLNKAIAPYEQGQIEYTDKQLDSIFHMYCIIK